MRGSSKIWSRTFLSACYAMLLVFAATAVLVQLPASLPSCGAATTGEANVVQLDHTLSLFADGDGTTPDVVVKKMTNERSRLVFVAGVEGTGHHAFRSFFDVCVLDKSAPECEMEVELSKELMTYNEQEKRIGGIFGSALAHKKEHVAFNALSKSVHHRMHQLAKVKERDLLTVAGLSYGNWVDAESGMLSYVSRPRRRPAASALYLLYSCVSPLLTVSPSLWLYVFACLCDTEANPLTTLSSSSFTTTIITIITIITTTTTAAQLRRGGQGAGHAGPCAAGGHGGECQTGPAGAGAVPHRRTQSTVLIYKAF